MRKPCIIRAAEQADFWLLNDHVKPMLNGGHTDDQLAIAVTRQHPGDGPPPHVHAGDDEAFYILEGEVTFLCGGQRIRARAGQFVWAPHEIVHCFQCTSATPSKMVLIVTPAQFMNFAMTFAEPAPDFADPPALSEAKIGQLMAVAPKYGITMLPEHVMPPDITSAASASKKLWVMGEHVSFLATSEQTDGKFTVVEIATAPQGGPPPHVHVREDEIFYVIDGKHQVLLNNHTEIAGPGDLVFVPQGTRHRYSNIGPLPGKILSIHTPGGFEAFFNEVGMDADLHATAPAMPPMEPAAMESLLARHGMTV